MSGTAPKNLTASVRQRLLNLSRKRHVDFSLILTQFAGERFLYRLGVSEYANRFILKGAMLLSIWMESSYRPTRDLDLLGSGDLSTEYLRKIFRAICLTPVEADGIIFDPDSIQITEIREAQAYEGQRVRLVASLGNARVTVQIDIGSGDVVVPEEIEFPVLLDFAAPRLRAYSRESFIAEKLEAIVSLGMPNSRMKDFYDLWIMSKLFPFDGLKLAAAIQATFNRRKTAIPSQVPTGLSDDFAASTEKVKQWKAFLNRNNLQASEINRVIEELRDFLMPPVLALDRGDNFNQRWIAGDLWLPQEAS